MRQLSELDASFLYLESETTPMHIGGVYLFDASGLSSPLAFSTLFRTFEAASTSCRCFGKS